MIRNTNVLVMNVTDRGIVAQVESSHSEGSQLCFISHERASMLTIEVPTKENTWMSKSKASRSKKGAFAKYSKDSTQLVQGLLATYPLTIKGEPWYVKSKGVDTAEVWQGLKAIA